MKTELIDLLTAYLAGWKTLRDCAEWLAGIDWDEPGLDTESRDLAGRIELLVTEVAEGLRPEAEFWQEAANIVGNTTRSLYTVQSLAANRVADSSNDRIIRTPEFIETLA